MEKTKDVMPLECLNTTRFTPDINAFGACSRLLIGPKGTATTSERKTRGNNASWLLFSRSLTILTVMFNLCHPTVTVAIVIGMIVLLPLESSMNARIHLSGVVAALEE